MKKAYWILFAFLCIGIGLYPAVYFLTSERFGLLTSKPAALLANLWWNIGFYLHIVCGGLALLVGWPQFSQAWRARRPDLHRGLGKAYVLAALTSSLAGIFIGFNATGGLVAQTGFVLLGAIWFLTTLQAWLEIRKGRVERHQKIMVFSFAACFAAVTLRLWLPLLMVAHHGDFVPAYRMVAWLCWVPNLAVAALLVRRLGRGPASLHKG